MLCTKQRTTREGHKLASPPTVVLFVIKFFRLIISSWHIGPIVRLAIFAPS